MTPLTGNVIVIVMKMMIVMPMNVIVNMIVNMIVTMQCDVITLFCFATCVTQIAGSGTLTEWKTC